MGRITKLYINRKALLRWRAKFNPMANAYCSPMAQVPDSLADTNGEPILHHHTGRNACKLPGFAVGGGQIPYKLIGGLLRYGWFLASSAPSDVRFL